ncbi:hypothetical protein K438DRAFT_417841 [Mycena galopus ATCC 62051]|nr:hypothetical protein K438DRAFT_417841 [Mycena galopus ATCC 62051]
MLFHQSLRFLYDFYDVPSVTMNSPAHPTAALIRLSERLQDAVLYCMETVAYRNVKNKLISMPTMVWEHTKSNAQDIFYVIGASTFDSLIAEVTIDFEELKRDAIHRQLVRETLKSNSTLARVLMCMRLYDDAPPCPFFGSMMPEEVGFAFRVYLGGYMVHNPELGLLRLRPWFDGIFDKLAAAAVRALRPRSLVRKPQYLKSLADLAIPKVIIKKNG